MTLARGRESVVVRASRAARSPRVNDMIMCVLIRIGSKDVASFPRVTFVLVLSAKMKIRLVRRMMVDARQRWLT